VKISGQQYPIVPNESDDFWFGPNYFAKPKSISIG
jgi:hypothetical protein